MNAFPRPTRHESSDAGFSLTEAITFVVLLQVVLAGAFLLLNSVSSMAGTIQARSTATLEVHDAVGAMTSDMRQAVEPTAGAGAFDIFEPTRCRFYSGSDTTQRVTYQLRGAQLFRTVEQASGSGYAVVSDESVVSAASALPGKPIFTYLAESTAYDQPVVATSGASITEVQVNMRDGAPPEGAQVFVDLSATVRIRTMNSEVK